MGLDLRSMKSTPGELFVAPSTHLHLASLVNKHRPVCTSRSYPINWKNVSLQACSYQETPRKVSRQFSLQNISYLSRPRRQGYRGLFPLHNGTTSHTSKGTQRYLKKLEIKTLQHPPCSPDISPRDYAVFSPLKKRLRGHHFATLQDLRNEAMRILKKEFKAEFYAKAIFGLKERWQTACDNKSEYLTHSRLNAAHYKCRTE